MTDDTYREFARAAALEIAYSGGWKGDSEVINADVERIHTHAILPAVEAATKELEAELATAKVAGAREMRERAAKEAYNVSQQIGTISFYRKVQAHDVGLRLASKIRALPLTGGDGEGE